MIYLCHTAYHVIIPSHIITSHQITPHCMIWKIACCGLIGWFVEKKNNGYQTIDKFDDTRLIERTSFSTYWCPRFSPLNIEYRIDLLNIAPTYRTSHWKNEFRIDILNIAPRYLVSNIALNNQISHQHVEHCAELITVSVSMMIDYTTDGTGEKNRVHVEILKRNKT